jgi:hypothetical protein
MLGQETPKVYFPAEAGVKVMDPLGYGGNQASPGMPPVPPQFNVFVEVQVTVNVSPAWIVVGSIMTVAIGGAGGSTVPTTDAVVTCPTGLWTGLHVTTKLYVPGPGATFEVS